MKSIVVIDAPSNLGLKPQRGGIPGVYKMPDVLRANGLIARLNAEDGGRVPAPPYHPERDTKTGVRNLEMLPVYSRQLAGVIHAVLHQQKFPLVLGGDCSILIGAMLALRKNGRYGLLFLDGHTDFLNPDTTSTGGAAGMDLAIVTGRGVESLTNIDGLKPLVRDEDVVVFGNRDVESRETYIAREIFDTPIQVFDLQMIRAIGIENAAVQAVESFKKQPIDGVWIHLDADVLHNDIMPAVDSPMPDGLTYAELKTVLRAVLDSELAVGMEVTIYDPDLAPDGRIGRGFTDALVEILTP